MLHICTHSEICRKRKTSCSHAYTHDVTHMADENLRTRGSSDCIENHCEFIVHEEREERNVAIAGMCVEWTPKLDLAKTDEEFLDRFGYLWVDEEYPEDYDEEEDY